MKVKVFCMALLFGSLSIVNAQQEKDSKYVNGESNYNSWSLSGYVGANSLYTGELTTDEAGFKFGIAGQVGVTKWFNHAFGVESLIQLGKTRQTVGRANLDGNTKYLGLSFNGVLNLNSLFRRGDLAGERKWNAYAYAGIGSMGFISEVENTVTNTTKEYRTRGLWRSIYPQGGAILSHRLNDNLDISARANFLLSGRDAFDGVFSNNYVTSQERLITGTIGLTYHFGDKEKLVWSDPFDFRLKNALADLKPEAPQKIDLADDDKDGVINQFDKELNTPLNVIVDGSGRALDIDQDGVYDGLDKCPTVKGPKSNNGCPIVQKVVPTTVTPAATTSISLPLGIKFDTNKSVIKSKYYYILNDALTIIRENPNRKFLISGYTDCRGDFSSNQRLSERRAISVKKYFMNRGVSSSQLQTIGNGENSPLNECNPCNSCSNQEQYENRRIVLSSL